VTVGVAGRAGGTAPHAGNLKVRVFLDGKDFDAQGSEAGSIVALVPK
jgi:hypothetical protein